MSHLDVCDACRTLVAELLAEEDAAGGASSHGATPDIVDHRFRLGAVIGAGATGTVYRARDEKLDVDVALKLLHAASPADARAVVRELTVGRRVTHPNVCRLHDAGEHDGHPYITMTLVEGATLAERIARAPIAKGEAVAYLEGIAAGLAAVHAQGIVHRDLKPANVLVAADTGEPILTDFGFAADLESKQSRRLVGTPSFWAPEQARGEPASPASDVYSFGVLAYRLLASRDFSLSERGALASVPRSHRAIVGRCLEPRPSARFADGSALVRALARAKSGPRVWTLAGAAAAVVATAAAAAVVTDRRSEPRSPSPVSSAPSVVPSGGAPSGAPPETSPRAPPHATSVADLPGRSLGSATGAPARHPPVMNAAKPSATVPSSAAPTASAAAPDASADDPLYRH